MPPENKKQSNQTPSEPLCQRDLHSFSSAAHRALETRHTKHGTTLDKILQSGTENPDSSIGCYAGDAESYSAFSPMFDAVMADYHHVSSAYKYVQGFGVAGLPAFSPSIAALIESSRIRVARSLENYPFESTMTRQDHLVLEREVLDVIDNVFAGTKFAGTYYSLPKLSEAEKENLIAKHLPFREGDKYLQSAGISSDWPIGRGAYVSKDGKFQLWINEEDHLRVMYMEPSDDIAHVAATLFNALTLLASRLKFARSDKYGYLNSCPTNVGTAMRASIHLKVPGRSEDELVKLCRPLNLSVRGTDGEHTKVSGGVYDISYKKRLGASERELLTDFMNAVNALAGLLK